MGSSGAQDSTAPGQALLTHEEWADATVWSCVLERQEVLYEPGVRSYLHHVHTVQHAFFRLWSGKLLDLPDLSVPPLLLVVLDQAGGRWWVGGGEGVLART